MIRPARQRTRGPGTASPWSPTELIRAELFGVERLEQHAETLAAAQPVARRTLAVMPLIARLRDNSKVLLEAYRTTAKGVAAGGAITPAAEWLLDNYHVVESQVAQIGDDLPPGYYRQLPKLAAGPLAGYPRVFGMAWAFIAHTDSRIEPELLRRFVRAYQRVQPLTIGELWAIAITLRLVLVENLRRAAERIVTRRADRQHADELADRVLGIPAGAAAAALREWDKVPLSPTFAVQLLQRLRDHDPNATPALQWLEARLAATATTRDAIVREEHQRQGAANITVRNVITSMRAISAIDWPDLFEDVSLVDAELRKGSGFALLDFPTRDRYRREVELLARGSQHTELEIARRLVRNAQSGKSPREREPGYYLIADGRRAFATAAGYRGRWHNWPARISAVSGMRGYIACITVITAALLCWPLLAMGPGGNAGWVYGLLAILGLLPAMDAAMALVNSSVTSRFGARVLPALELRDGIPEALRTMVVMPTLLTTRSALAEQIERLEVHHLASQDGDICFALLSDWTDADSESMQGDDALLDQAVEGIAHLNDRHGPAAAGPRFLLLHRRRLWNAAQEKWMGWERKRGKLHELNRLLRGATDTSFISTNGRLPAVPAGVRYVVTLDADTRLPRDTVRRLVGKMAHPLNSPRFDPASGRVVEGYGILQPRVSPSLPTGRDGSVFQHLFSSASGIDPYSSAVSDVYQDLCGEGSYVGKGIYEVDAFEAALAGRIPENSLLSHDLFEGIFARAGLVSDIEVVEEYPARYDVAAARAHRWARGDWQLLPWVFGCGVAGRNRQHRRIPLIGLWKILDNLRRTLTPIATVLALIVGWTLNWQCALLWTTVILLALVMPTLPPALTGIVPRRKRIAQGSHWHAVGIDARRALSQSLLLVVFLAHQAWSMVDAIARTLVRQFITHRRMLEWVTAAQQQVGPRLTVGGFYRRMAAAPIIGGIVFMLALLDWLRAPVALPLASLWMLSPLFACWASRPPRIARQLSVSPADAQTLRLIARRSWRYFETFVTAADYMLPPDNFQEDPNPALAHRTSPTNIGLYLLASVNARDLGWAGMLDTVARLEATFAQMDLLERCNGHFYNWYDTQDLRPLQPKYISTVDSGNLAAHLLALANACTQMCTHRLPRDEIFSGIADGLALVREALPLSTDDHIGRAAARAQLEQAIDALSAQLRAVPETPVGLTTHLTVLVPLGAAVATGAKAYALVDNAGIEAADWAQATCASIASHLRDQSIEDDAGALVGRLNAVASTARTMSTAMRFGFLLDPERQLLSIGYRVADNSLDPSCYDLLASEARLASFVAIANGDLPARHWFRLGRAVTPVHCAAALVSWSGSMFEYLMPSLVMRAPRGSLLEQTSKLIVWRQQDYADGLHVPWGISESAYNVRDLEFTYQYSSFGVPGLGLKRGLRENIVVAPYATALAAMVDPRAATSNYARLAAAGARGRYGFCEALDYTAQRLPAGQSVAIVRTYMAHHQGMTIVALTNTLLQGVMRDRFHSEPCVQATELLLQERPPRDVAIAHAWAAESDQHLVSADAASTITRTLRSPHDVTPRTQLLSNGRYAVMVTGAGSGYSRWGNLAVTRWREDATLDACGSFVFLRDLNKGTIWSSGYQPCGVEPDDYEVTFSEDSAGIVRQDGSITTATDIVVSAESDAEVRRISITNTGDHARRIELTSYAEIVLAPPAADLAHPAFSKLFVQTEYVPAIGALLATRRRRSTTDPEIWAAHLAIVEGDAIGELQFETDRARFLGRGRELRQATAIVDGTPLSGTVGTVLDPIFSQRRSVRIAAGATARVAFWTLVAPTRAAVLDLADKHLDTAAFGRAVTLAWSQAQIQLHHLGVTHGEAHLFQRLAGHVLYSDLTLRPSPAVLHRVGGGQSVLWAQGISGDLPIVLVRIDDMGDIDIVRQLLRAFTYWRLKHLAVDLIILNERAPSYTQDLHLALEALTRTGLSQPRIAAGAAQGNVFILRTDIISSDTRVMLLTAAKAVLLSRQGSLSEQLDSLEKKAPRTAGAVPPPIPAATGRSASGVPPYIPELEFANGQGGFSNDGQEYVTILRHGQCTPAPWINVIANPGFGFQVSAEGCGYTWAGNSRENQLSPWSNDAVVDQPGEVWYVRDDDSGALWGPTMLPVRHDGAVYLARHGRGYSRFEHAQRGVELELLQFVPLDASVKISRLTIRNTSGSTRRLTVTTYVEWVLGASRSATAPFIATELDDVTGAMLARNLWSGAGSGVAFTDLGGRQSSWTGDRREFIGRNGVLSQPLALSELTPLSGTVGAGLDPCSALQVSLEIKANATVELVWLLGAAATVPEAQALITHWRSANVDESLQSVRRYWDDLLGTVVVKTPDRAFDIMLNGWLLYQTLACRVWARSAFYQASGAYGFRDQLQDGMALAMAAPALTREHLLRAAARQFIEGDVQHWWLPGTGRGVRTRVSDDRAWLCYCVAHYVEVTGDPAVLDESVRFLEGPQLREGEADAFFLPETAIETASLFEHCARALEQSLQPGAHGLPLIGSGDWNDGMNRVGAGGQGESIWLGWFLYATIMKLAPLAESRGETARAANWRSRAAALQSALERTGWDGNWYRRGYFDDGTPLGTATGDACQIDSIAQSWGVISGAADPERAGRAMAAVNERLIRRDVGLNLLFTPPFDQSGKDPGYVGAYPPGIRENGGQYTHAAAWSVIAFAMLGDGDRAAELHAMLNPINRALTPVDTARYKTEPYVVAADVYSEAPHVGRGGWTWYTGSAGWMYRAGLESMLGCRLQGALLLLDPCIPSTWPGFTITLRYRSTQYQIAVENPAGVNRGLAKLLLDGLPIPALPGSVVLVDDGATHHIHAVMG